MAKEAKELEVENPFKAFNFLDEPVKGEPKKEKSDKKVESTDGDITPEAEAALEAAKTEVEEIAKRKTKSEPSTEEDEEDEEDDFKAVEKPKVDESEDNEFQGFARFLNEEGIVDLEEGQEVKSEKDLSIIVSKRIHRGIEEYKSSKPEDAQKFLEFIDNGGKPSDFHKYYYNDSSFEEFTVETEEDQKHAIREGLKLEGYSDEDIEDEILDASDLGKLEKKAQTHLRKLQKYEKEQKKALIEAQKAYAKEQESLRQDEWVKFEKGLYDKDEIAGFKFTKKMKDDTWEYMTKSVNKKTGETQYQIDSKENEDARYLYAYLLKNKYDVRSLERQVETKQVSKLKGKLSNYSDSRQKIKSGSSLGKEKDSNSANDFSAFRTVLNS